MSTPLAPRPATTGAEKVSEPLLREPPAPPGYVDPLRGHPMLEDLAPGSATGEKPADSHPAHTG